MRDFSQKHPTVEMDGDYPCISCKFSAGLGWCTFHKCEVSAFDGCKEHVLVDILKTAEEMRQCCTDADKPMGRPIL